MSAITLLLLGASCLQCYAFTDFEVQMHDAVLIAKCAARCWDAEQQTCKTACLQDRFVKHGRCPTKTEMSVFDTACIHACKSDSECSRTDKCCTHSCGATCQRAQDLQNITELPAIPKEVTVTERRRRLVILDWSMYEGYSEIDKVVFLIEERQHVGRHFSETRMVNWVPRHLSYNTTLTLHNLLRPGHWYQFRVAAVNENGTRGFSEPSEPFTLSVGPKAPGPPQNLTVGSCEWVNRTLWCELSWDPPAISDLPVRRYKVFWSRRVHEDVASVLVNHQMVDWNVRTFLLKGLQPESLYFLQVQALAQFGPDKLKGEKAAIFLNTADYKNASTANVSLSALDED